MSEPICDLVFQLSLVYLNTINIELFYHKDSKMGGQDRQIYPIIESKFHLVFYFMWSEQGSEPWIEHPNPDFSDKKPRPLTRMFLHFFEKRTPAPNQCFQSCISLNRTAKRFWTFLTARTEAANPNLCLISLRIEPPNPNRFFKDSDPLK